MSDTHGEADWVACEHGPFDKGDGYCLACDLVAENEYLRASLRDVLGPQPGEGVLPIEEQLRIWRKRTDHAEAEYDRLREAISLHHARIKMLGLNSTRGKVHWGGQWDHELWEAVGLPSGPGVENAQ